MLPNPERSGRKAKDGFRTELHESPTASRATRPDEPSTSHLPADVQAVQHEACHTATMEGIDFANVDAAVSTQRWRLPASRAARCMSSGDQLTAKTERADASIRQDLYEGRLAALPAATPLFATRSPAQQLFFHGTNCTSEAAAPRRAAAYLKPCGANAGAIAEHGRGHGHGTLGTPLSGRSVECPVTW